jgi:DNA-binding protein Fis
VRQIKRQYKRSNQRRKTQTITTNQQQQQQENKMHSTPISIDEISVDQMKVLMSKYKQSQAAKMLGVSLSTLKRKFYSFKLGKRWPHSHANDIVSILGSNNNNADMDTKDRIKKKMNRKASLHHICNEEEQSEKILNRETISALNRAFSSVYYY